MEKETVNLQTFQNWGQLGFSLSINAELIGAGVRDSCGNASPRETPQAHKRWGGSRTARGKRVPAVERNGQILQT
jgi:hypothetical protein